MENEQSQHYVRAAVEGIGVKLDAQWHKGFYVSTWEKGFCSA